MRRMTCRTASVVCDKSKGSLYRHNKTSLVGNYSFPLTEFACKSAHIKIVN